MTLPVAPFEFPENLRNVRFAAALLGAGAVILPAVSHAQAGPETADEAPLVVTASRTPVASKRVGQSVTVLTQAEIAASQQIDVSELIGRTPGVQLRRQGGRGTATSVYIRGADSGQSLVLYDGVRLHDPSLTDGGASLADVTTLGLGRIEILRGTQSVLYGSQAIGGVITIISARPTRELEAQVQAEAGSLDSYLLRGGVGGASGGLTWRAAAGYSASDGVSASSLGSERDGYDNLSLNGRIDYAVSESLSLDLRSYYTDGDAEFDAFNGDADNRSLSRSWLTYAGLNMSLSEGFESRISYGRTQIERANFDESDPANRLETFAADGSSDRLEFQGTYTAANGTLLVFGVEYAENAFVDSFAAGEEGDSTLGVYGNLTLEPLHGLTLTGGVRHEDHSNFGGATIGAASLAYTPNDGDTVLRASYSEGFKAPGLYQLFADLYGSPDLQPERAQSWEVGGEHRFGDVLSLAAVYFSRDTENLIAFVPCSADPGRNPCAFGFYANDGLVDAQGVELGAQLAFGAVTLSGNYTYLDARYATPGDANSGNWLARRAQNTFNASATYNAPSGLMLTAALSVAGDSFNDAGNTQKLAGYALVDLRASYRLTDSIELYARVENLFDTDYEMILDYSTMPRMVFGGVRARF